VLCERFNVGASEPNASADQNSGDRAAFAQVKQLPL